MLAYSTTILYLCIVVGSVNDLSDRMDNKYKEIFLKKKVYERNFLQRGDGGTQYEGGNGVGKHQKPHHDSTAVWD